MSSTVLTVGMPHPTPVLERPAREKNLCFSPLIGEGKQLATQHPTLTTGLVLTLVSFFGSLFGGRSTIQFLPATFIPTLLSVLCELIFPPEQCKNDDGPLTIVNRSTVQTVFESKTEAA